MKLPKFTLLVFLPYFNNYQNIILVHFYTNMVFNKQECSYIIVYTQTTLKIHWSWGDKKKKIVLGADIVGNLTKNIFSRTL